MEELFSQMSLSQVILYGIALILALKELLELIDFFKERVNKKVDKDVREVQDDKALETKIDDISESIEQLNTDFIQYKTGVENMLKGYDDKLELLINSDKDDIKAYIVERYHHFLQQGYIDDFSMDTLEKRYTHYVDEGGNSYIESLMNELRTLHAKQFLKKN